MDSGMKQMVNVLAIGFWAVGHLDSVHAKTLFYCFGRLVLRMVSLSIQKIFHLVYSQNGKLYKIFFILLVTRTKDQSCWSQYDRQECLEGRRQMPWMHWRCSCVDTSGIVKLMALKQLRSRHSPGGRQATGREAGECPGPG